MIVGVGRSQAIHRVGSGPPIIVHRVVSTVVIVGLREAETNGQLALTIPCDVIDMHGVDPPSTSRSRVPGYPPS